jgi:ankyrin repeat protein
MAAAYIVMGHGYEKPGRFVVPPGCTLVLTEECGMLGTIPFYVMETMSRYDDIWGDPVKHKADIERLLRRRIRIYNAGQKAPRLFTNLLSNHSEKPGIYQPSGIHSLPLNLADITFNPDAVGDKRYETRDAALTFRGAVFGSVEDKTWYAQEELFRRLPGVHYNMLCRESRISSDYKGEAVSLAYVLSATKAAFPTLRIREQGDPILTIDAWITTQNHDTFTPIQHEVAAIVRAEAQRLSERRRSSGSPLGDRDVDILVQLLATEAPQAAMLTLVSKLKNPNASIRHYGLTPLMAAARYGHIDVMDALLDAGASLEVKDGEGATALSYACLGDSVGAVRILMNRGANIHVRDIYGYTPLFLAAGKPQMVARLLAAGADVNAVDNEGDGPLVMAIGHSEEAVRLLIEAGADVNQPGRNGETPMFQAIKDKDEKVIQLLLETGRVKLDIRTRDGKGLVGAAVQHGLENLVIYLLEAGAPIKDKDALIQAAKKKELKQLLNFLER